MSQSDNKLGLMSLTALVVGSIIGAGVFALPQNMAAVASPLAVMIGWAISGGGMIFLALTFQQLCVNKPEISTGVFGYAKAGFGDLIGFFSAWGYWLSAVVANVSFLVIIFSTLGLFFDTPQQVIFGDGTTWISIALSSLFVWGMYFLLLRGVQTAALINLLTTVAKLIPIFVLVVATIIAFKWEIFTLNFSHVAGDPSVSLMTQVKETMLITVWVFIGIEGAVILSTRARVRKDVGRATVIGLLLTLVLYVLISLMSMGVISTKELAHMQNPSAAKVLESIIGPAGLYIVGIGLIISVCGAYLSWTMLAIETPYTAAKDKMFPAIFSKTNKVGTPTFTLLLSSLIIQAILLAVNVMDGGYDNLLNISSEMILVPYLLVGAFALKQGRLDSIPVMAMFGGIATVYGIWLLYASGLHHLLSASLLYFPGLICYAVAKRQLGQSWFVGGNRLIVLFLGVITCMAVWVLFKL
ncbi:basic amino acid/polyamine antiporter [Shewanella sp. NIFS-20-20]|uniref:basic amino acid/polyamine antiporter n=1 Tax=Shewanella sp. NIFS-20-20 TaxID=2853806 RepID=UPI001C476101|nr:basic amino acid/polyamine antiporter [Shewanella sp. NIFS-20-20]MBV7315267.1 basic amino acid/polyamine antiporter [Shewanella sp. NIFS-20-20]